jgi:CRP/FNR family transcriptional regulator, cyclic AMP receptor protein
MDDCGSRAATGVILTAFSCDPDLAALVAVKARYRDYPPHSTIVESGRAGDQVFLVIAGHARMLAFAIDGRLVVVHDYGAGDLFGEGGLLDYPVETDEVAAVDAVHAGAFPTPVFVGLMTNYSCIALAVSRMLVARLSMTRRRLVEGATLSAVGRIHAELLRQARVGDAMTIRPAPVLSQFALTVQSTRETVSRTINALQKRGIIRRDDDALTVVAPHRLEELIY